MSSVGPIPNMFEFALFATVNNYTAQTTLVRIFYEGHPGPRPSGARCARVHLRSCSDVANLGQNIQPEAAKRTVVQTATMDTGDTFMTINNFHANESVLVHILAGARMYAPRPKGEGQDGPRKISGLSILCCAQALFFVAGSAESLLKLIKYQRRTRTAMSEQHHAVKPEIRGLVYERGIGAL